MIAESTPFVLSPEPWWSWKTTSIWQTGARALSPDRPRYAFFWARNAIYHCLRLLNIAPGSRVLIPAYICRAAVDPFLVYGLEVDFYSIKLDCTADLSDIQARITPRTTAILAAHYFGFPQTIEPIREMCDHYHMALIEDCAHVLCGEIAGKPMGTFGDAAVFSWRKFLPLYDGGELVFNRLRDVPQLQTTKETTLFTLRVALNVIDRGMRQARGPVLRAAYRGFRTLESAGRLCADAFIRRPPSLRVETSSTDFDKGSIDLPMSRVSHWIKKHSDIQSIITRRRRNYQILVSELPVQRVTPLFPALPDSLCPWVLPLFFKGVPSAHRILRRRGIPAVAWDDVRHPAIRTGRFSDSDFLYENLVFLPIHQCLSERDMMDIVSAAKSL